MVGLRFRKSDTFSVNAVQGLEILEYWGNWDWSKRLVNAISRSYRRFLLDVMESKMLLQYRIRQRIKLWEYLYYKLKIHSRFLFTLVIFPMYINFKNCLTEKMTEKRIIFYLLELFATFVCFLFPLPSSLNTNRH